MKLYYPISTILIFIMVMLHKLQIKTDVIRKSRGLVCLFSFITLSILLIVSFVLVKILPQDNYVRNIFIKNNGNLNNLTFHISLFLLFYLLLVLLSILSRNVNLFHKLDVAQGVFYFLFILGFLVYSFLFDKRNKGEGGHNINLNGDHLPLMSLFSVIITIMITAILASDLKNIENFFNTENYGYICDVGQKFKDVSIQDPIICPTNKLY